MREKPDYILVFTEDRNGKRWKHRRQPGMAAMGLVKQLGHRVLYKINVYWKPVA